MGIGRLLVIAGLVWFAVMLYRRYRHLRKQRRGPHQGKLIRCAKCGCICLSMKPSPAPITRRSARITELTRGCYACQPRARGPNQ